MDMLVVVTVLLAAVLQQSTGQHFLGALDTHNENVKKEIIDTINTLRRNVSPPSRNMLQMRWSDDIATVQEIWVQKCAFYQGPVKVKKLDATVCGETLHKTRTPISWREVITKWYQQEENFIYGSGERFPNAQYGLYTQLVWALSYQVGCKVALCNIDYTYSCNFCPGTNDYLRVHKPYEEGEPCAGCPDNCEKGLCTNPCPYEDKYANCKAFKDDCSDDDIIKASCKATCQCSSQIY
ncbi:cysteine-rich secretory protein 2-like [Lissotriton helveticus]